MTVPKSAPAIGPDDDSQRQLDVYVSRHLLSLSHSTRPEVRLYCFWYRDKLVTGIFILPVVRCLGSVPRPRVKMDAGRVSTYSSFDDAFGNTVRWLWVLASVSALNKVGSLFW